MQWKKPELLKVNYKVKLNLYRVSAPALPFPVSPLGSGLSWRLAQPLGLAEEALRLVRQLETSWDTAPTGRHTTKLETGTL